MVNTNRAIPNDVWEGQDYTAASDEQLMGAVASGRTGALEHLYSRYGRPVYSLALRILTDNGDAEEVTQDVFERAWQYAVSFDRERGRVDTWLLSMTHHVSIDRLRRRLRRPQSSPETTVDGLADVLADPQQEDLSVVVVRNAEAEQVRRMLRSLPEEQRQAIELAYFKGLSHLEIAAALGDPLGTVKARIRRGMERLRSALDSIGIGTDDTSTNERTR